MNQLRHLLFVALAVFSTGTPIYCQSDKAPAPAEREEEKIYTEKEFRGPGVGKAVILEKPEAEFPDEAKMNAGPGYTYWEVKLSVVLRKSGEIGEIKVIKKAPYGLTESAIRAARRIKFKPAKKDGVPVSVYSTQKYWFTVRQAECNAPPNNGMHPTRDTTALINLHLVGGRVMPGVRPLVA